MTVYSSLPKPIALAPGASISLRDLLIAEFGSIPSAITGVYFYEDSAKTLADYSFKYWTPSNPTIQYWTVAGNAIAADRVSSHVSSSAFAGVTYTAGSEIQFGAHLSFAGVGWWTVDAVDPAVIGATAGTVAPTAVDIVASAYRFAAYYGNPPNDNDCHHIAEQVAAAAGAVMPTISASLTPSQNQEQGFWRIVYRGTDPGSTSHWQSLLEPGDIVRMGWTSNGGPHTTTVLSVDKAAGKMVVYDNGYYIGNVESIGIHTVTYDTKTIAADTTIYRLTTDGIHLINGSSDNDILIGSSFDDRVTGGGGNDVIDGGGGGNTCVYSGVAAHYALSLRNGTFTITDRSGADGVDTVSGLTTLVFADQTLDASSFTKTAALTSTQLASLVELYIASFNRAPDAYGLDFWGGKLHDGMSLETIAASFFVQVETNTKYPSTLSNLDFVKAIYTNVLGRTPDDGGLAFWTQVLTTGAVSRDQFMLAVIQGAKASSSGGTDALYLANKELVGAHFALTDGLNDADWGRAVMSGVDATSASVTAANALADSYLGVANSSSWEFLVQLVGVAA